MSAASRRHRLRDRLMLAFSGFALLVALLYGFYVVLFVYLVEDAVFQGLLEDEAAAQLAHHAETGAWTTPALRFVTLHVDPATFPDALGARLTESPWRREFPGEAGRHYHLRVLEPAGSAAPTWLLAEVSQHLVVRPMRGGIAQWLGWSGLAVTLLALLLGAWLARRMTAPLSRLAALVEDAEPTHLPTRFAEEFPDDEVGTLARGLERLIERVEAFVEREREFTRDASHELRTPLTVIRSACERLGARTDLPGEAQRQLQHVCRSAQQLERTVATLLALAREDVDTSAPEIAVLPVLERVIVDQAPLLEGRDVSIRVEVPHATQARLPAPVLHTVLSNLVGNAFAHGGSGDVVIDVDAGGLRIANPGAWPGEMAFRPFVKSEASAGVGLGLAIVRRLCARHRIALRFESEGLATIVHLALAPSGDA